jgi:HPt (histidine-containing phosphotransfer) domain-containing protein
LAVCDPSPKSFSRFDVSFLNELAALLSRALDRFQRERNLKTALAGMKQRLEWSSSSLEAARRQIDAEAAQRERVEVSLATEERYRFIFDHTADLIFLHWHAHDQFLGEPLDVNQTACQCLGFSRDELLMADTPLLTDSARTTAAAARAALSKTGRARFDIDLLSKNGQPLRFEFHCVLFELDGQPTVLSVARPADGTERSPEAEPPEPAWLFDEVLERVAGDRSLLADMVQLFSHDLDNRLARMGRSLEDRDVTGLKEQAHGLKGAAGNLSVPGLVAVCSELENVVDAENWSEAPGLQTRLMKEAEAFKREARSKGFLDPSGDVRAGGGSDQITYSSSGSSTS